MLQTNSLAKCLGHPPASALCVFQKHAHVFCLLFPEWSQHLEWSDSKKIKPGNWVLLDSWLGHLDIGGWMCFATNRPQEKTRVLPRNSGDPRAGKEGGGKRLTEPSDKELDNLWFHLKFFLISYQAKENWKSLSFLHTHTQKEFFF